MILTPERSRDIRGFCFADYYCYIERVRPSGSDIALSQERRKKKKVSQFKEMQIKSENAVFWGEILT